MSAPKIYELPEALKHNKQLAISCFLNVLSLHLPNHFRGKKSALRESSKIRVSAGEEMSAVVEAASYITTNLGSAAFHISYLRIFIQSFIIHSCCKYQHRVFLLCSLSLLFHYIFEFLFEFLYKTSKNSNY